jgi:hypothetical protein
LDIYLISHFNFRNGYHKSQNGKNEAAYHALTEEEKKRQKRRNKQLYDEAKLKYPQDKIRWIQVKKKKKIPIFVTH